jgi:hypothetical protein
VNEARGERAFENNPLISEEPKMRSNAISTSHFCPGKGQKRPKAISTPIFGPKMTKKSPMRFSYPILT